MGSVGTTYKEFFIKFSKLKYKKKSFYEFSTNEKFATF